MKLPLVSIITVNYNQTAVTCELLESLQKITYPNIEVFVVDNASVENPTETIKTRYPNVKVIVSHRNLGFAGGNNLGITQAQGTYLMFLNNDTEVHPQFLEPMVEDMEQNPTIGIVASKLHFYHTPNVIQFAGSTPLHPIRMASYAVGYGETDTGQYDDKMFTHLAHGAAMMVRKSVIQKAGLMPEEYFLYYEEIDWCERIKKAGYRILFEPKSLVYHKESISVGKKSAFQLYYKTRNRILLARRWRKGVTKYLTMSYLGSVAIRDLLKFKLTGERENYSKYLQAIKWHFN